MQLHINELLFSLSKALDCVEHELAGVTTNHSKRVALLSMRMCAHMGFTPVDIFDMASCAILHDNALTEYSLREGRHHAQRLKNIEFHCSSGEENAKPFPFLGNTQGIILYHHENWDGSGFFHLKGKEINTRAAMLRLADHTDLLFGMNHGADIMLKKTRAHVENARGSLYSPEVADVFLDVANEHLIYDLADENIDNALACTVPVVSAEVPLDSVLKVCEIFSGITDAKSPFTCHHSRGVGANTQRCAKAMGYSHRHVLQLTIAAHLHDVGKLSTPPSILEKPSGLTPTEFEIMRKHVDMTEAILSPVRGMNQVAQWAASHHEKINGTGYHRGLEGDQLDNESRLLACVDVYQALVEDRPYRVGMPHKQATEIMDRMVESGALDAAMVQLVDETLGQGT